MRTLIDEHYERELQYVLRATREFKDDRERVAGRLGIGSDRDPHIQNLVRAFALLNARIRQKIDDGFPEITATLLDLLYPHHLRPIPSLGVARFDPPRSASKRETIPAQRRLATETVLGEECEFRTLWDVDLPPMRIAAVKFENALRTASSRHRRESRRATLTIDLELLGTAESFAAIDLRELTFHVAELIEPDGHAYALYRTLVQHATQIVLEDPDGEVPPLLLDGARFEPVGLDGPILDDGPRADPSYALLTEFFACPRRFLFVRLHGWERDEIERFGRRLRIRVDVSRKNDELETGLRSTSLALGCTPVVNLFPMATPGARFTYDQTRSAYEIIPDLRREDSLEVYSVDRVSAVRGDDHLFDFRPFYAVRFAQDAERHRRFYTTERRESRLGLGTDLMLSFADLDPRAEMPDDVTVRVETHCCNRQLHKVRPRSLSFVDAVAAQSVSFVGGCTAPVAPVAGKERLWRLLSHVALNQVPITASDGSPEPLRQLLDLYTQRAADEDEARMIVDSICGVTSRRATAVVGGAGADDGVRRGLDVTVDVDATEDDDWVFVFGSILDRFFGLMSGVNSYTRLTVRVPRSASRRAGAPGDAHKARFREYHRWEARSGRRALS